MIDDDEVAGVAARAIYQCPYCELWQIDVPFPVDMRGLEALLGEHLRPCQVALEASS